jgi:hypothetical protein
VNATHAVVSVGGKFRVMTFNPDSDYPRQSYPEFSVKTDFISHVVDPKIEVVEMNAAGATRKVKKGLGAWWLTNPLRRSFDGLDFIPGGPSVIEMPDARVRGRTIRRLNLWSGFSVEPAKGDCALYLKHVSEHACQKDETLYEYVMNWMASGVQKPQNPARAALSMRGKPGAGKGVLAREYGKIFGRHFSPLTQREHIIGKFNAHTAEACLTFADEALFVGDARDADILKTLISEEDKHVERKFLDPVRVRNFARLIFASNHDHALRIEANGRRYCALHVVLPDDMVGSAGADKRREYFAALVKQMENGGRAALVDTLLNRDISNFNPEAIPQTEELAQQKLLSAPPADQIIIQLADDATLPGSLINRPWIARAYIASGGDGLFDVMRKRGGKALDRLTDNGLTDILKRWGFKRKKLMDGNGWDSLREQIRRKYPAVEWTAEAVEWARRPRNRGVADYPSGQLGITHGHRPHGYAALPPSFGCWRKSGCLRLCGVELSPEVGDGANREGGISWGCLTPPLLHRRSDMPCRPITCSS